MANKGQASISWPVDPETGEPMAIVSAFASEHVGSGAGIPDYCGIDIGPTGSMVPCKNDPAVIQKTQEEMLRLSQFIVGSNRRHIYFTMNPEAVPRSPDDFQGQPHEEKAKEDQKPPEVASTDSAS